MVFNAAPCRNSMYRIGFQPALKINDVEVWLHTDRGLYASLWWVGEDPIDSCLMQSEHVGFRLNGRKVEAILEPGVMRMYIAPTHALWNIEDDDGEDDDYDGDEID